VILLYWANRARGYMPDIPEEGLE